ncbi:hypothetical protein [Muribaculum intestinale]|uniref:hypothetical protein n=1 Tax=Muribaculum intestinale TaxID=1796646 RepID=UPI0025DAFE69|nr:hypothetical protein [Muribaculum intestinale]
MAGRAEPHQIAAAVCQPRLLAATFRTLYGDDVMHLRGKHGTPLQCTVGTERMIRKHLGTELTPP